MCLITTTRTRCICALQCRWSLVLQLTESGEMSASQSLPLQLQADVVLTSSAFVDALWVECVSLRVAAFIKLQRYEEAHQDCSILSQYVQVSTCLNTFNLTRHISIGARGEA